METVRDNRSQAQAWRGPDNDPSGLGLDDALDGYVKAPPEVVRKRLNDVIENDVIPRLMLAHCLAPKDPPPPDPVLPRIDDFTALVLQADASLAADSVQRLLAAGVAVDRLFLDLLAPAARRLGEMWTADEVDFVHVTVALSRLQQIQHGLSGLGQPVLGGVDPRKTILLAPAPGEQHTFGLTMVSNMFGEAGWQVTVVRGTAQDVVRAVRRDAFTVVGFSLSCETRIEALASAIRKVRKASRNRSVGVLVGGRVFAEKPETSVLIGADATAHDGPSGVTMAQSLLDLLARAC